jgi:repressor LexA
MYSMNGLSQRSKFVLAFVHEQFALGRPPSLAEIAKACGFASRGAARKHIRRLADAGLVEVTAGQARGIRPIADGGLSVKVPILGRVAAGAPIGADAELVDAMTLDAQLFSQLPDYFLRVQGDSMIDEGILDGDLVGIRRTIEAQNGQIVVARLDGEVTIKRLYRSNAALRLLPRNPVYRPIEVKADQDFAIEGVFCGLVRRE